MQQSRRDAGAQPTAQTFDCTLPRFDLVAQLDRHPDGLKMGELSRRLMVTGGNITGITDQLESDGWVERAGVENDRRAWRVRAHAARQEGVPADGGRARAVDRRTVQQWGDRDQAQLYRLLGKLKDAIRVIGTARPGADMNPMRAQARPMADALPDALPLGRRPTTARIATITLDRPERKNPLTFESYAELRDLFRDLVYAPDVKCVVVRGAGDNFCSGGDVHEIIGPLTRMTMPELLAFTRMTGDLVLAMRRCPQPIVAAVDGICAGAGAIIALAADFRLGTPRARTAYLFTRVGLAGCDMGACTLLPRLIGQGRAAELLYTGRAMTAGEGLAWGFFNRSSSRRRLHDEALALAADLVAGPTFAHGITKTMLHQEWNMSIDQAIEAEAQAQALCMQTEDFRRAFDAFAAKQKPVFEGD